MYSGADGSANADNTGVNNAGTGIPRGPVAIVHGRASQQFTAGSCLVPESLASGLRMP